MHPADMVVNEMSLADELAISTSTTTSCWRCWLRRFRSASGWTRSSTARRQARSPSRSSTSKSPCRIRRNRICGFTG